MFGWLLNLFGYGEGPFHYADKLKGRTYHFDLPYKLTATNIMYAIRMLKKNGLWNDIPRDLQLKLEHAEKKWRSVNVEKADLDRLPDNTWAYIAKKLGLKWE